jgi:hypothetical protein
MGQSTYGRSKLRRPVAALGRTPRPGPGRWHRPPRLRQPPYSGELLTIRRSYGEEPAAGPPAGGSDSAHMDGCISVQIHIHPLIQRDEMSTSQHVDVSTCCDVDVRLAGVVIRNSGHATATEQKIGGLQHQLLEAPPLIDT